MAGPWAGVILHKVLIMAPWQGLQMRCCMGVSSTGATAGPPAPLPPPRPGAHLFHPQGLPGAPPPPRPPGPGQLATDLGLEVGPLLLDLGSLLQVVTHWTLSQNAVPRTLGSQRGRHEVVHSAGASSVPAPPPATSTSRSEKFIFLFLAGTAILSNQFFKEIQVPFQTAPIRLLSSLASLLHPLHRDRLGWSRSSTRPLVTPRYAKCVGPSPDLPSRCQPAA